MTVLVTGGAGFIGSHTCAELVGRGDEVVVVDDYSNSSPSVLPAIGQFGPGRVIGYRADVRDADALDRIFARHDITAVVHFAALKSVSESVRRPRAYYEVNVTGTLSLLGSMQRHDVTRLVFSSSCSLYGDQQNRLIAEDCEPRPANPYAASKLMCERIMADACTAWPGLSVISLRYFNPIGAHPSGLIGEDPQGALCWVVVC
ncbi:MAG TPA: SDR family NAD(P)-dependent oxidoreductase [Streptosporangiaceae bacterium]